MIAAGEAGGILDTILKRLAVYIEKNVKLKGEVKSAMIYPVAVIVIAARRRRARSCGRSSRPSPRCSPASAPQLPLPTRVVIALEQRRSSPTGWFIVIALGLASATRCKRYYATDDGPLRDRRASC